MVILMSKRYARKLNIREKKEKFLIICEGEKTEPNYFKSFPINVHVVDVDVKGYGYNTLSLVEEAINRKESAERNGLPYNQVWCVFDKDDFCDDIINRAIYKSIENKIKVAWSNEAFELWYLLHYDYHTSAIKRWHYIEKLNNRFKDKYEKNDPDIYEKLKKISENCYKTFGKTLGKLSEI